MFENLGLEQGGSPGSLSLRLVLVEKLLGISQLTQPTWSDPPNLNHLVIQGFPYQTTIPYFHH